MEEQNLVLLIILVLMVAIVRSGPLLCLIWRWRNQNKLEQSLRRSHIVASTVYVHVKFIAQCTSASCMNKCLLTTDDGIRV
ncbi:hypothetical protein VNO77_24945 [Canavalia gladiata]|uniref:Uncharacterized protein n=1 Tax=Canavalia gladiata TaxID=3824 RepID=A0AAN9L8L9_CANGL